LYPPLKPNPTIALFKLEAGVGNGQSAKIKESLAVFRIIWGVF